MLVDRRDPDSIVPPATNLPYVIAVVIMALCAVAAIVLIAILRPGVDNTALNTTIIGVIAPTTLSLLAFMKSQETHLSVNSRLDGFMKQAREAAHIQGVLDGRTLGVDFANARTDALQQRAQPAPVLVAPAVVPPVVVPALLDPVASARLANLDQIEQHTADTVTELRQNTAAIQDLKGTP